MAIGTLADKVMRPAVKCRAFEGIRKLVQKALRPFSFAFYGFVCVTSLVFTVLIISVNGTLDSLDTQKLSLLTAFKSVGPILLAVILKIFIWDYLLAIKTYVFIQTSGAIRKHKSDGTVKGPIAFGAPLLLFIMVDLFCTAMLTAIFLNWSELAQSTNIMPHAPSASATDGAATTNSPFMATNSMLGAAGGNNPPDNSNSPSGTDLILQSACERLINFFDTVDFIIKDSIKNSFYALNGSTILYLSLIINALIKGSVKYIDEDAIQNNIFACIGLILALMLFSIFGSYNLASS